MNARFAGGRAARGFTLLEVLVVLVITGMISAILIQGLGVTLNVRNSIAATILDLKSVVLNRNIIAEPVIGVIPDYPEKPYAFRGDRDAMQGLTIRSLDHQNGVPRPFRLYFQRDMAQNSTALIFQTEGQESHVLGRWPGSSGFFAYHDLTGGWQEVWPPPRDDRAPQTPWLVRINTGVPGSEEIVAFVASPHERRYRVQDIMGDANPDSRLQ